MLVSVIAILRRALKNYRNYWWFLLRIYILIFKVLGCGNRRKHNQCNRDFYYLINRELLIDIWIMCLFVCSLSTLQDRTENILDYYYDILEWYRFSYIALFTHTPLYMCGVWEYLKKVQKNCFIVCCNRYIDIIITITRL